MTSRESVSKQDISFDMKLQRRKQSSLFEMQTQTKKRFGHYSVETSLAFCITDE